MRLWKKIDMNIAFAFMAIALCSLVGCVSAPTADQLRYADYGSYPLKYESIVKEFMYSNLKDPESATYRFEGAPVKMWAGGGLAGAIKYGWGVTASINAKNSFGGYVGAKRYFFLIKEEQVIYFSPMFGR